MNVAAETAAKETATRFGNDIPARTSRFMVTPAAEASEPCKHRWVSIINDDA